jgi:hypothetical protein
MVMRVSTTLLQLLDALGRLRRRFLPSKVNGRVTTPTVSAPCSRATWATNRRRARARAAAHAGGHEDHVRADQRSGSGVGSGSGSGSGSGGGAASAAFTDADVLGFFSHLTVGLSPDGKSLAYFDVTVGDPNTASAQFVDISGATATPGRAEPFKGIDPEGMKVDAAFIANRVGKVNNYLAGMQPLAGVGFKKGVASLVTAGATTKVAYSDTKHTFTMTPPTGTPVTAKVDDGGGVTTPTPIAAFALPGGRAAVIMQYRGRRRRQHVAAAAVNAAPPLSDS